MKTDATTRLKEIVSEHYQIGDLVEYKRLHLGYVNVSYIIEVVANGERKKYFFRQYKRGIKEEEVRFEHSVINHLIERGFELVAGVIRTRDGKTYVRQLDDGGEAVFYAIFDFLPGEDKYTWVNPDCGEDELRNAASVLARFHEAVFDLQPAGKRYEPQIVDLLPAIAENAERCAAIAGETEFDVYFLDNLGPILETTRNTLSAISAEYAGMVHQVIHCDYHPGNLKFQDGEIVGLFDFDWSKVDARCFDVALAMTYFCTAWEGEEDGELQLDKVAVFLKGYQDTLSSARGVGPLNDVELKYLPHMISASNIYVLNWTIRDFYGREADPGEHLLYLRHGVRTMRWLENGDNWDDLEKMIVGSLCK